MSVSASDRASFGEVEIDLDLNCLRALKPGDGLVVPVFDASHYGDRGERLGGSLRIVARVSKGGFLSLATEREAYGLTTGRLEWRQDDRGWAPLLEHLSIEEARLYVRSMELVARALRATFLADFGLRKEAA